jgi:trehalose 6-phosphate synthase
MLAAIPGHEWLMRSLFAYDLIGFQAESDVVNFARYALAEAQAEIRGPERFRAYGRTVMARAFPIGIDVDEFVNLGQEPDALDAYAMLQDQYAKRRVLVGVDRLDYSKGLPQRIRAFRELLDSYPAQRMSATLIQIASPSREDVEAYADIRRELESLCGEINGEYGELDWMPIRYIHRTVARKRLPGMFRASRVALVTPLRDGMNLVAKEFVAAQNADDPGVLVLSRFAGAAEQMKEALLVNPYDVQGTAATIERALLMSQEERVQRHAALLERIRTRDVHWWRQAFLDALQNDSDLDHGP